MSAIVLGKRCFVEDVPTTTTTTTTTATTTPSKRIRYCSSSPMRFSPPPRPPFTTASPLSPPLPLSSSSCSCSCSSSIATGNITTSVVSDRNKDTAALAHLRAFFPNMDKELIERALEECGGDLDSAVKRLNELCLQSAEENIASGVDKSDITAQDRGRVSSEDQSSAEFLPKEGSEWVELFVREMTNASSLDDARARAARVLEFLEESISNRVDTEVAQNFQKEHLMLKEQTEGLLRENTILKRAVAIQHERQKEYEDKKNELQHLKQLLTQYQEQLRVLEVNNYALMMHLKQAQQNNNILGRFHPDIF